jgi:hypothetical protein
MLIVKNNTEVEKIWCGQTIEGNGSYQIQSTEQVVWANDETFIEALAATDAILNDGFNDLAVGAAINILKQIDNYNRDKDGNPIYKNVIAENSMMFKPRVFDFYTGKYNSLCNKSSDLIDLGDAELKFFDDSQTELTKGENESDIEFQARLDTDCEFTWLIYTPSKRYAIKSGEVRYSGSILGECDLWVEVAPHIPKAYGGSVPFIDGGLPLDFYNEREPIIIDGANCAMIDLDTTYYSHKLGVKVEHEPGNNIGILAIFNKYE